MPAKAEKDFNAMLQNSKDMPKIQIITDPKTICRYGGTRMLLAPPLAYDALMKQVPAGKLTTTAALREVLARAYGADFTDPMTAGIFTQIAAWASEQRSSASMPWWRTLKSDGELNPKYPGGIEMQRAYLETEGHIISVKGRKTSNIMYLHMRKRCSTAFLRMKRAFLFSCQTVKIPRKIFESAVDKPRRKAYNIACKPMMEMSTSGPFSPKRAAGGASAV